MRRVLDGHQEEHRLNLAQPKLKTDSMNRAYRAHDKIRQAKPYQAPRETKSEILGHWDIGDHHHGAN